ncbi:MAG: hypothetical protein COB76_00470 [Alphaproteobacteria bacterium]|nr:MAG: hypothetical protein COB76_00470 [Alphaproteobacteria bacterium]
MCLQPLVRVVAIPMALVLLWIFSDVSVLTWKGAAYLTPPLSIAMLVMLGLSELHPYVVIGTILIIGGNAVFVFEKKKE